MSLLPFAIASTCGPFPPPALPGFTGTTGLSATLSGPTLSSRVVGWRVPRHRQGFPCCAHPPLPCVPPPLPRRNRSVLASLTSRPLAAFPVIQAGRLPHYPFRGLRGVHDIAALMVAEPPGRPFVIGVLQPMSLPPSSAPTATGWNDSCRAGFAPAEEWRLVTAH